MKHLLKTILLLGILCLAGCKKEDYVKISLDRLEIGNQGGVVNVAVSANCPWRVTLYRNTQLLDTWYGADDYSFPVTINQNSSYSDFSYTFKATGEGGTDFGAETLTQEARIGLFTDGIDLISEEGGTFEIPVRTNDDITSVDTPDWMTFTSSRSLAGYTYTFTAEPNKTGTVRNGTVSFKGKSDTWKVEVTQDSYAPESINLEQDLSCVWEQDFKVRIAAEPEYADLSKLEVKILPDGNAVIEDGYLIVGLGAYGEFSISILQQGKGMLYTEGACIPTKPFRNEGVLEIYLGQRRFIDYWFYSEGYDLTSSDEKIASPSGNKYVYGNSIGDAVLTVTHPVAPSHDELTVKVVPFLVDARIGWTDEKWDGSFDVRFTARVEGTEGMSCDGFYIKDKDGVVKILNDGKIINYSKTIKEINTSIINVKYDRNKYSDISGFLKGWQITVQSSIGKNTYQRSKAIDTMKTGF